MEKNGNTFENYDDEWYLLDSIIYNGNTYYLLESEEYGDEHPALIVSNESQVITESWNGFDDLFEYFEDYTMLEISNMERKFHDKIIGYEINSGATCNRKTAQTVLDLAKREIEGWESENYSYEESYYQTRNEEYLRILKEFDRILKEFKKV